MKVVTRAYMFNVSQYCSNCLTDRGVEIHYGRAMRRLEKGGTHDLRESVIPWASKSSCISVNQDNIIVAYVASNAPVHD
jgi:hypothetical protein